MNCHEFTESLDERGSNALEVAAHRHAARCPDCGPALAAAQTLAADGVPALRPEFGTQLLAGFDSALEAEARSTMEHELEALEDATPGAAARSAAQPIAARLRRWRPAAAIGAFALGGLVFASVALYVGSEDGDDTSGERSPQALPSSDTANAPRAADDVAASYDALIDLIDAGEREAYRELTLQFTRRGNYPDGDYWSLLRVPPVYPRDAAERELEGEAVVEFTVTAEGNVADATIVRSSDPVFEAPSIEAVEQFKYKPRVVDGRAVDVPGVRNLITYALPGGESGLDELLRRVEEPAPSAASSAPELDGTEFRALLAPALDCLPRVDLRCIELELDALYPTHPFTTAQRAELDRIYGYIHYQQGNYQRAIDAYLRAVSTGNRVADPALMIVARIHFELAQYQDALDAAVTYLRAHPRPTVADYAFVDHLRQLGAVPR